MSAFQVSPLHLTTLAAYIATTPGDIYAISFLLAQENLRSVSHRYGHRDQTIIAEDPTNEDVNAGISNAMKLDPYAIHKLARCYAYQACEHPAWDSSAAFGIIEQICKNAVMEALGGWDEVSAERFNRHEQWDAAEWSI
tara:strand:- start:295 stop:711 length:417 start_codon:yes stop_codon:yes gene_type:complete